MTQPACTVIIATYNRCRLLMRFFDYLDQQDIGPNAFEVVLVDDGSTDDTQALLAARQFPYQVRVIKQNNQGAAAARNTAILAARTDLIMALDDDVMPASDLLRLHIAAHEGGGALGVMGPMILPPGKRLVPWLEWEAIALEKQYTAMRQGRWHATARQFYTANASFRKQDFVEAGLFDSEFRRAEDVDLAYRMGDVGVTFEFLSEGVVYHEPNRTYRQWLEIPRRYGYYDVRMWQDKGRNNIVNNITSEFKRRPRSLQIAARALVGRGPIYEGSLAAMGKLGRLAGFFRLRGSRFIYGAIFNLQYWQGFAETIGGRREFWNLVSDPAGTAAQIQLRLRSNEAAETP